MTGWIVSVYCSTTNPEQVAKAAEVLGHVESSMQVAPDEDDEA